MHSIVSSRAMSASLLTFNIFTRHMRNALGTTPSARSTLGQPIVSAFNAVYIVHCQNILWVCLCFD
eukprot:5324028-Amphidinium_carterae.1